LRACLTAISEKKKKGAYAIGVTQDASTSRHNTRDYQLPSVERSLGNGLIVAGPAAAGTAVQQDSRDSEAPERPTTERDETRSRPQVRTPSARSNRKKCVRQQEGRTMTTLSTVSSGVTNKRIGRYKELGKDDRRTRRRARPGPQKSCVHTRLPSEQSKGHQRTAAVHRKTNSATNWWGRPGIESSCRDGHHCSSWQARITRPPPKVGHRQRASLWSCVRRPVVTPS